MVALEIAVTDVAGLTAAAAGGADRIELSCALELGGLSPSMALIEACVGAAALPVHVLVRPRPGDFVLGPDDLAVAVRDVRAALAAGASGVVVGATTPDGRLDLDGLRALVAAAEGAEVTLHRAFDVLADPSAAVDQAATLGITRILTSGGAARAVGGLVTLSALIARSAGRVQMMAGGGVRVEDVASLASAGVDAIHLSAKRAVATGPAGPGGGASQRFWTDRRLVAAARAALDRAR